MTRSRLRLLLPILTLLAGLLPLAGCAGVDPTAARNVVEYHLRKTFPPLLVPRQPPAGAMLSGVVRDEQGQPLAGAWVLASSVRGQYVAERSDAAGRYHLAGVAAGETTPMAAAWGFEPVNGQLVRVHNGQTLDGVDFTLPAHRSVPVQPQDVQFGAATTEASAFPQPMTATRIPFSFTADGVRVDNGQIYLPAAPAAAELPTLVIIYPSHPLNWNEASVALTRDGYRVLALGPHSAAGLDIDQHARFYRAAVQLWQAGQLTPLGQPRGPWVAMSGSFGSLILFKALIDLPTPPSALVNVGGISNAFLGVQALYDADLAIPPPYDSAVAALGRPDRDPAYFYGFSPVFYAEHLPPMLIVHTYDDEVIPYTQAEALAAALDAADRPYELLLYHDTTHYLNAANPTPGTRLVYDRVLAYVQAAGQ